MVHGTWSDKNTWKDKKGINRAIGNLFNDKGIDASFSWSGGNFKYYRSKAAGELIKHIRKQIKAGKIAADEPITLIGHSHGGNVIIEAVNMMMKMPEFDGRKINILTINTPVRSDYQLSKEARNRVSHVNVYDPADPVQASGGSALSFLMLPTLDINVPYLSGEIGPAERTFSSALNIRVDNAQSPLGDFHNSHNRTKDWLYKTKMDMVATPKGNVIGYYPKQNKKK